MSLTVTYGRWRWNQSKAQRNNFFSMVTFETEQREGKNTLHKLSLYMIDSNVQRSKYSQIW
jgi:hypothetical protein